MGQCYLELRKSRVRGTDSIVADIMRHLHTRQHLGKVVIISDQPVAILSAARKQWLKLSRIIQKQRAQTLNADKILKYTYTITHMQHMQFSATPPNERPEADVYFVTPEQTDTMPTNCLSVYLMAPPGEQQAAAMLAGLPSDALIVDYDQSFHWKHFDLKPKKALEARVTSEWQRVCKFLQKHGIDMSSLIDGDMQDFAAMDDALDTLLGISYTFLQIATDFQRALELARPLRLHKETRATYDSFVLLAHRVQALSPTAYTHHFLESYNEDDTFFLYDAWRTWTEKNTEDLISASVRHETAGRRHLAKALRLAASFRAKM
ncbi:MAG TPA: hypothetical protein VJP80_03090 [Candidatus Saccharimonadales bacterium]|nr:hypothetical protein [Candidatus Saccharimonadales bacterium]